MIILSAATWVRKYAEGLWSNAPDPSADHTDHAENAEAIISRQGRIHVQAAGETR